MARIAFERVCSGVYATADRLFFVERCAGNGWRLNERAQLRGYKPSARRTSTVDDPIWLRSNSARAACAWARDQLTNDARSP